MVVPVVGVTLTSYPTANVTKRGVLMQLDHKFLGEVHKMSPSVLDYLKWIDIVVPVNKRLFLWFILFNFEAILSLIRMK